MRYIFNCFSYFLISFILLFSLSLIDLRLAAFAYAIPAIGCFHGAQGIGVIPHLWGYRRYDTNDLSHNNWLASILALGEGWHNNHHRHPGSAKFGINSKEIDISFIVIKILEAMNLANGIRYPNEQLKRI